MERKTKIAITWTAFLLGMLVLAIIIYVRYKAKNPDIKNIDGNSNTGAAPTDAISGDRILKKGDRGNTVGALQEAVNEKITLYGLQSSIPLLVPDKVYGPATDSAINKLTFQTMNSSKGNVSVNAIKNGNFSTPDNTADVISTNGVPAVAGQKMYALVAGTEIYKSISDWFPERYAGLNEYLGTYKNTELSWIGNAYAITNEGRAVLKSNVKFSNQ